MRPSAFVISAREWAFWVLTHDLDRLYPCSCRECVWSVGPLRDLVVNHR